MYATSTTLRHLWPAVAWAVLVIALPQVATAADGLPAVSADGLDSQADRRGFAQSAADRILREWASALRLHLDAAQGKMPGK